MVVCLGLLIGNEAYYHYMLTCEESFDVWYPNITEEVFQQRIEKGEYLHVIDNLVINLKPFAHKHPGGKFLLDYTVGRDISKFFYGGHGLDNNKPNPNQSHPRNHHSNIARKIVLRHVVATIGSAAKI